jgi:hypothetical protein
MKEPKTTVLLRTVEPALLRTYGVPKGREGAFRGKTGGLQKEGLFGPKGMPGKGTALRYGPDELHKLVFACELFEFGIAPSVVLALVKNLWDRRLRKIFHDAEGAASQDSGPDDIIMHMGGINLMTEVWKKAVPNVNSCRLRDLPYCVDQWMTIGIVLPRAIIVNLSARLRVFHRNLAEANREDMAAEGRLRIKEEAGKRKKHSGRPEG